MPSNKVDQSVIDDMRRLPLFAGIHENDVTRVAELGEPVDAEPGAILMDQGDVGTECFFVMDGQAGVFAGGGVFSFGFPNPLIGGTCAITRPGQFKMSGCLGDAGLIVILTIRAGLAECCYGCFPGGTGAVAE